MSENYCLGSCMSYCHDCKWHERWKEVGEFGFADREIRWPNLKRLSDDHCQITNGSLFALKDQPCSK